MSGAPADRAGDQLALMRRVAAVMFLAGGLVCLLGVAVTQRTAFSRRAQAAAAAVIVLSGVAILATRPRRRVIEALVAVSIATIGFVVAISNPIGTGATFFLWPLVYAAYFSARRVLVALLVEMVAALTLGLLVNDDIDLKLDMFVGVTLSVGLMAGLVSVMTARQAELRARLEEIAATDPLTGLLNRRAFDPAFAALVAAAVVDGAPLTVVMFDLDHFKRFNDEHGHLVGDRALQRTAEVLREHSREGDAVARFGGEEFAVALPGCDAAAAWGYTDRVAAALRAGMCTNAADGEVRWLRMSVSAGIRAFDSGSTPGSMLSDADAALYAAKEGGRARAAWTDRGGVVVQRPFTLGEPHVRVG